MPRGGHRTGSGRKSLPDEIRRMVAITPRLRQATVDRLRALCDQEGVSQATMLERLIEAGSAAVPDSMERAVSGAIAILSDELDYLAEDRKRRARHAAVRSARDLLAGKAAE